MFVTAVWPFLQEHLLAERPLRMKPGSGLSSRSGLTQATAKHAPLVSIFTLLGTAGPVKIVPSLLATAHPAVQATVVTDVGNVSAL